MPLRVSVAIYREAFRLFVRRFPVYRHPTRTALEVSAMSRLGLDATARRIIGGLLRPRRRRHARSDRPVRCPAIRPRALLATVSDPMHAVVTVHEPRLYARLLREGSVGLGEAYADGWWDADDLTTFLRLAHRSLARTHTVRDRAHRVAGPLIDPIARLRPTDKQRDRTNVRAHYDLGNELFQHLLDETMMYSCAVFESPARLARGPRRWPSSTGSPASSQLAPDDHVLEIGTGWGGFAVHAAGSYGCHVTTTTISAEQFEFARARVRDAGLEHLVTVRPDDYRDIDGTFDKVIAIEMIEAVDWREYDAFFAQCRDLLIGRRAARDAGDRGPRRQLRSHQAHDGLHQGGDLPGWVPSVGRRVDGGRDEPVAGAPT